MVVVVDADTGKDGVGGVFAVVAVAVAVIVVFVVLAVSLELGSVAVGFAIAVGTAASAAVSTAVATTCATRRSICFPGVRGIGSSTRGDHMVAIRNGTQWETNESP